MAGGADLEGAQAVSRYRWIVFDADGTLFDFDAAERVALARTLRTSGVEPAPDVRAVHRTISIDLWADFERGEIDSQRLRVARFEREGYARDYLRLAGRWRDHVLTALVNDDWSPD